METLRPNGCFFLASGFLVKKAEGSRGEATGQPVPQPTVRVAPRTARMAGLERPRVSARAGQARSSCRGGRAPGSSVTRPDRLPRNPRPSLLSVSHRGEEQGPHDVCLRWRSQGEGQLSGGLW